MTRDIQFTILEKIRAAGIPGDAVLYVSQFDARAIINGLQVIDAAINEPETIERYEGTEDNHGVLTYKLDPTLPATVAAVEQRNGGRIHISLAGITD